MKKTLTAILALALSALLLSGCSTGDVEAFIEQTGGKLQGFASHIVEETDGTPHFDDIEYIRPDLDVLRGYAAELDALFEAEPSYYKTVRILDKCYDFYNTFYTMYNLADIRSCQDLTDEYYAEESLWMAENFSTVQQIFDDIYYACADSSLVSKLERSYFWEGFAEEYSDKSQSYFSGEYVELMQQESKLISEYRAITAAPTVEYKGSEQDFYELLAELEGDEYNRVLDSYYLKYNDAISNIYIELVDIRNRQAELLGYESYEQMQYQYYFERDYTPEQAAGYIADIKEHMVPFYVQLMVDDPYSKISYDYLSEQRLYDVLSYAAGDMGGDVQEAFEFMSQYGMYDISVETNKAGMSFQSYLTDYDAPFLFLDAYGDVEDIIAFSHEFGHYVDAYVNYDAYETIDVSECFSQAMEYLMLSRMDGVLDQDEVDNLFKMKMLDTIDLYVQQASFAEFESQVYAMGADALSAEALNELSLQLAKDYGYYSTGNDVYYAMSWMDIPHFFEYPFYVISYPVTNDIAMQIYELEQQEEGLGLEKFIQMLPREYNSFLDTVSSGELESPFTPGRIEKVVKDLQRHLVF